MPFETWYTKYIPLLLNQPCFYLSFRILSLIRSSIRIRCFYFVTLFLAYRIEPIITHFINFIQYRFTCHMGKYFFFKNKTKQKLLKRLVVLLRQTTLETSHMKWRGDWTLTSKRFHSALIRLRIGVSRGKQRFEV